MPVVLSQHYLASDREYEDVEYSLYHFPKQYFGRIKPYDRFIYYRPLGGSQRRSDSLHYFGYGNLGQPFPDSRRTDHRFVPIIKGVPFKRPVSLRDSSNAYYETETARPPVAVSAVREISEITYYRILAAAGVQSGLLEQTPSTEDLRFPVQSSLLRLPPRDALREIVDIPAGAGYVPNADTIVNIYESAALQERARADHQSVLKQLAALVQERGGKTWYNNNIDLLGDIRGARMLIEAKSLNRASEAINRMRYGMGQLFDYRYRYKADIGNAVPVLAFGRAPDAGDVWIGSVLEENGVAFVGQVSSQVVPLNELAEKLPIFR